MNPLLRKDFRLNRMVLVIAATTSVVPYVIAIIFAVNESYADSMPLQRSWANLLLTANHFCLMQWPVAAALLALGVTGLVRRSMFLLYPFWILSLLPVAVIAPRYHIIPLVLLLLFKSREDPKLEWATFAYLLVLTATLSLGVFAHRYTL